ncbi:MAG: clostripain-related cysteine peptidase [Armatimonadetes bacterium]|nr:clostripain-related cysteine peptidase [Armatimonadota bacterium]MDW8121390.1 clostripain-related cysteine peptidase [Armatimonadota bacterium]
MTNMKREWVLPHAVYFIIFSLCLFGCDSRNGNRSVTLPEKKQWTVLVYQGGDNDLEAAMIKDFNEMERVGTGGEMYIVVQLDRSPTYDTSNDNWVSSRRYQVTRDPAEAYPPDFSIRPNNIIRSPLLADLGRKNTGDPQVLEDFLIWGVTNFPADRYIIILSDHGAGVRPFRSFSFSTTRGMMFSDSFNDYISEDEARAVFSSVVQRIGRPIDIVGLDCSEMSEIEVAYQFRGLCRYLIASQLSEPNDGYPYERFLMEIRRNPDIATEELLRRWVNHYIESYLPGQPTNGAGDAVTIAVYNMNHIEPYVQAVDQLAGVLTARVNDLGRQFVQLRERTQSFSEAIYRDVYHYCQLLRTHIPQTAVQEAAQAVMDRQGPGQGKALLYEAHRTGNDKNVDNAHGIAIYFPHPRDFDSRYLRSNDFARINRWGTFLRSLAQTQSGQP